MFLETNKPEFAGLLSASFVQDIRTSVSRGCPVSYESSCALRRHILSNARTLLVVADLVIPVWVFAISGI